MMSKPFHLLYSLSHFLIQYKFHHRISFHTSTKVKTSVNCDAKIFIYYFSISKKKLCDRQWRRNVHDICRNIFTNNFAHVWYTSLTLRLQPDGRLNGAVNHTSIYISRVALTVKDSSKKGRMSGCILTDFRSCDFTVNASRYSFRWDSAHFSFALHVRSYVIFHFFKWCLMRYQ